MLLNLTFALVLARCTSQPKGNSLGTKPPILDEPPCCAQKMPPRWALAAVGFTAIVLVAAAVRPMARDPPELRAAIDHIRSNNELYRRWQAAVKKHRAAVRQLDRTCAVVSQNQAAMDRAVEAEQQARARVQELQHALRQLPSQGDGNDEP